MSAASSRRTLLAGALGALAGATVLGGPASADAAKPVRLRVATFNIHHGAGTDGVLDLERIAEVVDSFGADIVALQEVDRHWSARSEFADQPAVLGGLLGMHTAYGANLDLDPLEPGQPRRQYGTAILSRRPILSWRNTHLPKYEGHEQRGLLEAVVQVRGARVRVACTHLQHNDNTERELQAAAIVGLLGEEPERTVLMGDLNASPGTPEIDVLTGAFPDTWDKAGDGPGYTYDTEEPHVRIDYVLASPDVRPVRAEVVTDTPEASDHLPVVADVKVRPGR